MNPVEWLVYAAAYDVFSGPWRCLTQNEIIAAAEVLTEGERRWQTKSR